MKTVIPQCKTKIVYFLFFINIWNAGKKIKSNENLKLYYTGISWAHCATFTKI